MDIKDVEVNQPVTVYCTGSGARYAGTVADGVLAVDALNNIVDVRVTDSGNTVFTVGTVHPALVEHVTPAYDTTIPHDGADDETYQEHRRERSTDVLTWHSAGTDEPGDQQADAGIVRGYWLIGPDGDGWSLSLIEQNDALEEVFSWAWPAVDELHAKSMAESAEKFGQAPPKE